MTRDEIEESMAEGAHPDDARQALLHFTSWRPMETAPLDGTEIMVVYHDGEQRVSTAYRSSCSDSIWALPFRHHTSSRSPDSPMAWLPLVPPPKGGAP
jgi:hypothetical protein